MMTVIIWKRKWYPPKKSTWNSILTTLNHCQQGDFEMEIWGTESKQNGQKNRKKKTRCWEIWQTLFIKIGIFNSKMIIRSSTFLNLHCWRPQTSSRTLFFIFFKSYFNLNFTKWFKTFQKKQNFENFHVFWQILEKSYCCRSKYFFTVFFRKIVSIRENPTLTLKKQVFEAWKSSKIDHLDGRHQCKFIFSFFSWNFRKSLKTLNFLISPTEKW